MIYRKPYISKKVGENWPIGLRYHSPDLENGQTIASAVVTVAPSGLTLGGQSIVDNRVEKWVSGGSAGVEYTVTFEVTMSDGKVVIDDFIVRVE